MSVWMRIVPETAGERARAARGYDRVRRDAETTRYFLGRPGMNMPRIWELRPRNSIESTGVRPLEAKRRMPGRAALTSRPVWP